MAFQLGLPVLIFREVDVVADGVLDEGMMMGAYMPTFKLYGLSADFFADDKSRQVTGRWAGQVHTVVTNKGCPPGLY